MRVIVVDPIVVATQWSEVVHVGFAAVLPRLDVVDFALVRATAAIRAGADRLRCPRHVTLLRVGEALQAVLVHRAFCGVEDHCFQFVVRVGGVGGEEVGAGDGGAVGKPKHHVIAFAADDAHPLGQRNEQLRPRYRVRDSPAASYELQEMFK